MFGDDGVAPGGNLYLTILKGDGYELGRCGKTWPSDEVKKDEDDEVEIIDEDEVCRGVSSFSFSTEMRLILCKTC